MFDDNWGVVIAGMILGTYAAVMLVYTIFVLAVLLGVTGG